MLKENIKEIKKIIEESSSIYIMGHKYLDLDALGAGIGIYEYAKSLNKKPILIINDKKNEKGVARELEKIANSYNIKRSNKVKPRINDKSVLIIVDTNKKSLLQAPDLLELFKTVLVIDHHETSPDTIKDATLIIEEASSACEMVTNILEQSKTKINSNTATILLSGIVLDTNNYTLKTTAETYRASYILASIGANPNEVQGLLKQNLKDYSERQKVITNAKTYKKIAISTAKSSIYYRREDLAKIADALLQFNNIETTFVIGKLDRTTVGISARSQGNIDAGAVLAQLNGGGNKHEAGSRIENKTIKEVEEELKKLIKDL